MFHTFWPRTLFPHKFSRGAIKPRSLKTFCNDFFLSMRPIWKTRFLKELLEYGKVLKQVSQSLFLAVFVQVWRRRSALEYGKKPVVVPNTDKETEQDWKIIFFSFYKVKDQQSCHELGNFTAFYLQHSRLVLKIFAWCVKN